MKKINKLTREKRLEMVLELLGRGHHTFQIVDICSSEWKVGRRAVEKYLTSVYAFLKTSMNEKDKDKILLEYEELILRHEKFGDHKMAALYRERRDKILGLYITKTDITSGGEKLSPTIINFIRRDGTESN